MVIPENIISISEKAKEVYEELKKN